MTAANQTYPPQAQRLKEAIWRVQFLVRQGRISQRRAAIVDHELGLVAGALGVEALDREHDCPLCGKTHSDAADNEV